MKTFLKILIAVAAALLIAALIMIATRMDANTGFLEAGRKWIESIGGGDTLDKAAVEEYVETSAAETYGNDAAGLETEPDQVDFQDQLTAVDENGNTEIEGGFSVENDQGGSSSGSTGNSYGSMQLISADTDAAEETPEAESYRAYEGLPETYDEYLDMSRADRVALAESMGDDFDPWIEDLKAHQDDGKIIITATDQMETLE